MALRDMDSNVLYRFYSQGGWLLYIGITNSPPSRFRSHRMDKEWWDHVAVIAIEHYGSREDLIYAECRAIRREHPFFNVMHNEGYTSPGPWIPGTPVDWPRSAGAIMLANPGYDRCPACGRESFDNHPLGRFIHADGTTDNVDCWLAISSGRV